MQLLQFLRAYRLVWRERGLLQCAVRVVEGHIGPVSGRLHLQLLASLVENARDLHAVCAMIDAVCAATVMMVLAGGGRV